MDGGRRRPLKRFSAMNHPLRLVILLLAFGSLAAVLTGNVRACIYSMITRFCRTLVWERFAQAREPQASARRDPRAHLRDARAHLDTVDARVPPRMARSSACLSRGNGGRLACGKIQSIDWGQPTLHRAGRRLFDVTFCQFGANELCVLLARRLGRRERSALTLSFRPDASEAH